MIELSEKFSLENAAREYLPRLSLSGKATYQSDTTSIPFKMPGMTAEAMDKDQFLLPQRFHSFSGMEAL